MTRAISEMSTLKIEIDSGSEFLRFIPFRGYVYESRSIYDWKSVRHQSLRQHIKKQSVVSGNWLIF